jgi:DNA-binding LacI/PurR family transcriptional regulator
MHVTLQDVARLAGVSSKTVSRVVNDQGEISEATRQRVQAAIEQLGYRPNIMARNLVSGRSDTLAVMASGLEYYGPSHTLVGIEQQSYDLGYSLLLSLLPRPDDPNVNPVLDTFIARRVDGIIWAVPEISDNRAWIKADWPKHLPPIVFLSMEPQPELPVVAVDNHSGAAQATQHLLDQGRRRIGLISGPLTWWEARERYAGWRDTLQRAGLQVSPSLVVNGDWTAASGEQGMRRLLEQQPDIDAVFACNDQMALGALGVAHQSGRSVPQDLAIVGFDNIPESAYFWPPLTTVYQQLVDVGRIAVQVLHKLVEARRRSGDGVELATTVLKPELVIRASSLGATHGRA